MTRRMSFVKRGDAPVLVAILQKMVGDEFHDDRPNCELDGIAGELNQSVFVFSERRKMYRRFILATRQGLPKRNRRFLTNGRGKMSAMRRHGVIVELILRGTGENLNFLIISTPRIISANVEPIAWRSFAEPAHSIQNTEGDAVLPRPLSTVIEVEALQITE